MKLISKIVGATLGLALAVGVGYGVVNRKAIGLNADEASTTYTFTNKSWNATSGGNAANWTSGQDGAGFSNNGIQVTTAATGANGTSPISFTNVVRVVLTYNTNKSKGAGSFDVKVGTNDPKNVEWAYSTGDGTTANYTATANYSASPETGNVKVTINTTTNSCYLVSCEIVTDNGGSSTPTTYTVTYNETNKTSGSAPTDSTQYETGDVVTVEGNTGNLARTGYTWSGWSLNQNGSGTAYGPNYTTTYTVTTENINFYPIWVKDVTPLPSSGTITIDPSVLGNYGTDVAYTVEEDNTPGSEFNFSCTDVTKGTGDNAGKLQFKKSSGVLYSTTPLSYIRSVTIGGSNTSDAEVTYGTSSNAGCTSSSVGSTNTYFKVRTKNTSYARYWTIVITYGPQISLNSITAVLDEAAAAKTWYAGDELNASDIDVTTSYSDSSLNSTITDGSGVYFNNTFTQTKYSLTQGTNNLTVYYKDVNERSAHVDLEINNVQAPKTVQAWSITGSIGETVKSTAYDLSGLTLHAYYDAEKQDEASSSVAALYELVADPAVAGDTPDPNNKISVKVYLKTDTGHANCLETFTNVPAPIANSPKGSEDNPYTVAEARDAIDAGTGVTGVYATGIVSEIVTPFNETFGNISYNISSDGLTTSDQLQAYRGKDKDGAWFTSANDVKVGATVIVYGNLKKYNSTYEFDADNQLYSYHEKVLASLALSGTYQTEFTVGDTFNHDGVVVTATYEDTSTRVVTSDAVFSEPNMAVAGSKTVTVTYSEGGSTKQATYTIAVKELITADYKAFTGDVVNGDYLICSNGVAMNSTISSNRAQYISVTPSNDVITTSDDSVDWRIEASGNYFTIFSIKENKYLASTGADNKVQLLADGTDDKCLWEISKSEEVYLIVNKYNSENSANSNLRRNGNYGFACYGSGTGTAINLYKKVAKSQIESLMTQVSLNYDYENPALKFSGLVSKTLWDELDTDSHEISGVGVLFSNADRIANLENINSLKDCYDAARAQTDNARAAIAKACSDYGIIDRYSTVSESVPAVNGENCCKWSIVKKVSTSLQGKVYVATAYIIVGDDIVFLQQTNASINGLLGA